MSPAWAVVVLGTDRTGCPGAAHESLCPAKPNSYDLKNCAGLTGPGFGYSLDSKYRFGTL